MRSFLGSKARVTAPRPFWILATILSINLGACGGPMAHRSKDGARLAADGVSFDPVPIDVAIDCNYHILQGTQRFRGTYFVIPKVTLARDLENKTAIKLLPLDNGNVAFDFAINLQRGTESRNIVGGPTESERFAHTCNFAKLRESINKHYEELKQPENKVWSLSPLPITNIEMRIDGIGAPVMLSPEGTDLTTWLGETLSKTIELNKADTQRMLSKVSRGLGIQLVASFKFEARETREFGSMTFNGKAIAGALESSLGYEGPSYGGVVLESELKSKLAEAIRMTSAEAVIESESDQLSEAANALIKLMMEKVSPEKLVAKESRESTRDEWDDENDQGSGSRNRRGSPGDRNSRQDAEGDREKARKNEEKDPWDVDRPASSVRDRVIRRVSQQGGEPAAGAGKGKPAEGEAAKTDKPAEEKTAAGKVAPVAFKVQAVLDFLRSQTDTKIQYRIMGKLVSETATTRSRMISGKVGSADERTIEVSSDSDAQALGVELDKDQTLTVIVPERKLFRPEISSKDPVYFSKAGLLEVQQRDGVNLEFPQLVDWGRRINEYTPNELAGPRAYVYDSNWNPFNWAFYVWGKEESDVSESLASREVPTAGEKASLRIRFSRISQAFTLEDLTTMAKAPQQKGALKVNVQDDGSLTITANQRLGGVSIQNTEKFERSKVVAARYFQEKWSSWNHDRLAHSTAWSSKVKTKAVAAGRSSFTVRLLQSQTIPDVTFQEN